MLCIKARKRRVVTVRSLYKSTIRSKQHHQHVNTTTIISIIYQWPKKEQHALKMRKKISFHEYQLHKFPKVYNASYFLCSTFILQQQETANGLRFNNMLNGKSYQSRRHLQRIVCRDHEQWQSQCLCLNQ